MVSVTSIEVKEDLDDIALQLRQAETPSAKERLQVLYWLKQENAPSISTIAKAIEKHRNTLQTWLAMYREGGIEAMLEVGKSPGGVRVYIEPHQEILHQMLEVGKLPGGVRVIPQWAEAALAKRLQEAEHGFHSYGEVQQWLEETLGVEAEYHAVYQMTRYRLKAKLKAARPEHIKQDHEQREAFKKTFQAPLSY